MMPTRAPKGSASPFLPQSLTGNRETEGIIGDGFSLFAWFRLREIRKQGGPVQLHGHGPRRCGRGFDLRQEKHRPPRRRREIDPGRPPGRRRGLHDGRPGSERPGLQGLSARISPRGAVRPFFVPVTLSGTLDFWGIILHSSLLAEEMKLLGPLTGKINR